MATINGGNGNSQIVTSNGNDSINGNGGNDQISAGGGDDTIDGGADNDDLRGEAGNDSIIGGQGADTLDGGDGNDTLIDDDGATTVRGGAGDDEIRTTGGASSVQGGTGNDLIEGSDDNDILFGEEDNDTIQGNGGDDQIFGGTGDDSLDGGAGNDTLRGGEGRDSIDGGDGRDSITGEDGDDTIDGGAGDDTIFGGAGDDSLAGGAGNDILQADAGADTLEGGEGDDTLRGGADTDTFVIRDGHGSDEIFFFGPSDDIIAFDMAEIATYQDVLDRITTSGNDTLITFDNGDVLTLKNVPPSWLSASNFTYSAGPVCLLEGTPICTNRGEIAIEDLRPDEILWTKDHGWQALQVVVLETVHFRHRDDPGKPILIPAGALGGGRPIVSLITSPQHRILQTLAGTGEEVLVPAVKLIGMNGIRRMRGRKSARYFNVVMERHSIIQAAGCWVESMLVTSRSISRQHPSARKLLNQALGMQPARRIERKSERPRQLKNA